MVAPFTLKGALIERFMEQVTLAGPTVGDCCRESLGRESLFSGHWEGWEGSGYGEWRRGEERGGGPHHKS